MKNSDESNVYNFNYKERGIALLIHNEHFKKLPPRSGDDTDRKHMKKVAKILTDFDPNIFYVVEDVRTKQNGIFNKRENILSRWRLGK